MGSKFKARQKARGDFSRKSDKYGKKRKNARLRNFEDDGLEKRRNEIRGHLSYEYF